MRISLLAFLVALFLTSYTAFGQRNCGTMQHYHEAVKKNPEIGERRKQSEQIFRQNLQNLSNKKISNALITIPVVVHVVYHTTQENIPDEQIHSQIERLNKDFQKLNTDIVNVPPYFQPVIGNAQIQFVLAKRTPDGSPTTGITRTYTEKTFFNSNDEMKFSNTGGIDAWDPLKYLNIWVCNLSGSLLGYAQFPNETLETDGIVINYQHFGETETGGDFNLGRTATHEVGHYFNLYHIWGDATCGDDEVNDTPIQEEDNIGCPEFPQSTCGNEMSDMFMNYMDYVNDACMIMFSKGQVQRMRYAITFYRPGLATSDGAIPPGSYCSGLQIMYESVGSVSDGSGSENYNNNSDCKYLIQPAGATSISLNFTEFSLSDEDVLTIYDGDNSDFPLLGSYTGTTLPPTVTSSGGSILLHFSSNGSGTSSGWSANYTSTIVTPEHCNGHVVLTEESGIITDGSSYEYYQPLNECSWLIKPEGEHRIRLQFEEFDVEKDYDFLEIYDGEDITAPVLATLTGFELPGDIMSTGNKMFIRWITDDYVNFSGFKAIYSQNKTTDVTQPAEPSEFKIYPNPANSFIIIEKINNTLGNHQSVKIMNMVGQTVMEETSLETLTQININNWEPGMYYLIINDSDRVFTSKIRKY
ncbi:MAG TPA: CUB domain-containing protein [Cytophagaceae bacterium]